jgi:hypothetical protein
MTYKQCSSPENMGIEICFTASELASEARFRGDLPPDFSRLAAFAYDALAEMDLHDARAFTVLDADGHVCIGSGRIPLRIETPNSTFVIKRYDLYNPALEQQVLGAVQGELAPAVYHFAKQFYAEEFLPAGKVDNLQSMADRGEQGLQQAMVLGGGMHARLAARRIDYCHKHWLDEFNIHNGQPRITDFGTAHFFLAPGSDAQMDDDLAAMGSTSVEYFNDRRPIPCFERGRPRYEETRDLLWSLSNDPVERWNLLHLMRLAAIGIKEYLEVLPARVGVGFAHYDRLPANAWDHTMEVFPLFVASFQNSYKLTSSLRLAS